MWELDQDGFETRREPCTLDSTSTSIFGSVHVLVLSRTSQKAASQEQRTTPLQSNTFHPPFTMAARRSFRITVPCTSANIGPGFDVVGLSLSLHLVLEVSHPLVPSSEASELEGEQEQPLISYTGQGAAEVPTDAYKNLTTRVALYVMRCHGIERFPRGLIIKVSLPELTIML